MVIVYSMFTVYLKFLTHVDFAVLFWLMCSSYINDAYFHLRGHTVYYLIYEILCDITFYDIVCDYVTCTHPYENRSFLPHREIIDAVKPVNKAVQSKNIWNESDINPRLQMRKHFIQQIPTGKTQLYNSSKQMMPRSK